MPTEEELEEEIAEDEQMDILNETTTFPDEESIEFLEDIL